MLKYAQLTFLAFLLPYVLSFFVSIIPHLVKFLIFVVGKYPLIAEVVVNTLMAFLST